MPAYVVWSSAFAVPPLVVLTLWQEGWTPVRTALEHADAAARAVAWQAVGNSLFGYAAWGWLLARYPAASRPWRCWCRCSAWALRPSAGRIAAGLEAAGRRTAVMGGLALNLLWPHLRRWVLQRA